MRVTMQAATRSAKRLFSVLVLAAGIGLCLNSSHAQTDGGSVRDSTIDALSARIESEKGGPELLASWYVARGGEYWKTGDYDRAIADYGRALELDPDYAGAFVGRGLSYYGKGDIDRAIADVDRAIRLKPEYAEALAARGVMYSFKGDSDRAIADFDRAIRLKPGNANYYFNRGAAYMDSGHIGRALLDWCRAAYYYVTST
jgi:tetratricopeptide (TPR) repeat protein